MRCSPRSWPRSDPRSRSVPIDALRLVVGFLLLVFGLQWLRKAILRASGFKAAHDEDRIYAEEVAHAREAGAPDRGLDGYAFTVSFKSVLLEGLEIAFIVLTLGASQGSTWLAAAGSPRSPSSWRSAPPFGDPSPVCPRISLPSRSA